MSYDRLLALSVYAFVTLDHAWAEQFISDIVMAVLEGRLALAEIASQAKRFVREHYDSFQDRAFVSLDEIKPETTTTWLECLTANLRQRRGRL